MGVFFARLVFFLYWCNARVTKSADLGTSCSWEYTLYLRLESITLLPYPISICDLKRDWVQVRQVKYSSQTR